MNNMSSEPLSIGVAIFGLGRIGKVHLNNLARSNRVRIRWLVDIGAVQGELTNLVKHYRLKDEARVTSIENAGEVYQDERVKAVFICCPSVHHEDIVKASVRAGKHVFCEKPLAVTLDAVRSCYEEAAQNSCILFCAFNKRFDPELFPIYKMKETGKLGKLRKVVMTARDPPVDLGYLKISGGIFNDSCVHQLDYVCYFVGERPIYLTAIGNNNSARGSDYANLGDVDLCNVTLVFPGGCIAVVETCREITYGFDQRFEVLGSRCFAKSKNIRQTESELWTEKGTLLDKLHASFITRYEQSYANEVEHFINVLEGKEEVVVTPAQVTQANELAALCMESMKTGQRIRVPPLI